MQIHIFFAAAFLFCAVGQFASADDPKQPEGASPDLFAELKKCPHKIAFETKRDGNWHIYLMNADGSNPVNLSKVPDVDELYPKVSPDGSKICFVVDEGKGKEKVRNLYLMNLDGSGRKKIADNAREPCWNAEGTAIAHLKGEFEKFSYLDFATKGIVIYDVKTGKTREHPNKKIQHLYTLNWTPDGKWFVATVHGGMGFKHAILAIQADSDKVVDLKLDGCRPDLSPDGKQVAWGHGDHCAGVADIDWSGETPKAKNQHDAVEVKDPIESYHMDWSPDAKYLAFSRGPKFKGKRLGGLVPELPGVEAPDWNICVCDVSKKNRWVALTFDGKSNKEPDWVFVKEAGK